MKHKRLLFMAILSLFSLVGCFPSEQEILAALTQTQAVRLTNEHTYEPSPIPTQTNTPSPTRTSTPAGPEKVSWNDAWRKVGAVAKVCGEVVTVAIFQDGRRIVNLGEIPSNGGVIVVITDSTIFSENEIKSFYNKDICVTGEIIQDGNNFGIFVTNPSQIEMNE